ncbi:MAG TPA: peptidoglycan-binding protein [Geobacter sp.]|nr:peptidoglycan-binding protein [Geobacter sp.]
MNTEAFQKAYDNTMRHEGGFSNDPDDPGGMTYMGISREYHPSWSGWYLVDEHIVNISRVPDVVHENFLLEKVQTFYASEFWDRLQCDFVAGLSVDLAVELFDTAVNLGRHRAIEIMQDALNLLNRNGALYIDLVVDGQMGMKTRGALAAYFKRRHAEDYAQAEVSLIRVMNHLQAAHYIRLMRKYPWKEKYAGWFART